MFEKHQDPLLPIHKFVMRLIGSIIVGLLLIIIALGLGMVGYHHYEHMSWIDAFVNAAMILSGMGPLGPLSTYGGKLFAGCYAIFSGLAFILIISIVFAPVVHRFFHKFHLDDDPQTKNRNK
jgi:hypothetical protein